MDKKIIVFLVAWAVTGILQAQPVLPENPADSIMKVVHTADFRITGDGSAPEWAKAQWKVLQQPGTKRYETMVRIMYSDSGIYCLYHCEDRKITSTLEGDFLDLWNEDVVEAFFWTDERMPVYFEYELSPRNFELPILVPNYDGRFLGWRPWHYEGNRLIRHATSIQTEKPGGNPVSWTAEFYIPYTILNPIVTTPPVSGTRWRANFYRIDYDAGPAEWYWMPVPGTFHDYKRYGTLLFQ
jgi:hypothetical protein